MIVALRPRDAVAITRDVLALLVDAGRHPPRRLKATPGGGHQTSSLQVAMLERLRHVVDEFETLERQLSDPEVLADSDQLRRVSKRYNELGPVVEAYRRRESRRADAGAAREMLVGAAGDERDMLVAEIEAADGEADSIEDELRELMLPADPHDGKNVIVEIRGRRRWRRGEPVRSRPVRDVPRVRGVAPVEGGDPFVVAERHGWLQRRDLRSPWRRRPGGT